MITTTSKRIATATLALLIAAQLSGCSDSDNGPRTQTPAPTNPNPGNPGGENPGGENPGGEDPIGTPGAKQGVFVDSPVAGLSYTTSSDLSGVTDDQGRYEYNEGDTVTFSIGELVLGTVPAQGVVTPMTVAEALAEDTDLDAETVAVNLLMLLQSLDSNGDPEDGITFTAAIREALGADAIDLASSVEAFSAALTSLVANVAAAADVELKQVSADEAIAHFQERGVSSLTGVYVLADANYAPITQKAVTLTIMHNGYYLLGGQWDRAECNLAENEEPLHGLAFSDARGNGVEYGLLSWDPIKYNFTASNILVETDGHCGFNHPIVNGTNWIRRLRRTDKGLMFTDEEGVVYYRFARLEDQTGSVAGAWVQPTALMLNQPFVFAFFPSSEDASSGRYLMVDASAPNAEYDTSPGIEEGCYSIADDGSLTVELNPDVCPNAVDTNDTAGASNPADELKLFVDEHERLTIVEREDRIGFARLPIATPTYRAMKGSWILESEPGTEPADEERLFMLTVFEDGRFLFGTQENDSTCVPGGYPNLAEADGNGIEYGDVAFINGLAWFSTLMDTNGECGLYDALKEFTQFYYVSRSPSGDALVVWPNDEDDEAGIVFKRAPSEANSIVGTWMWEDEEEVGVIAFLPGGVMFDVSHSGIARTQYSVSGSQLTVSTDGYEHCVDTLENPSMCETGEGYSASFELDGNTLTVEDDTLTRIK